MPLLVRVPWLLLLLLGVADPAPAAPSDGGRPLFLWQVQGGAEGDGEGWLLGSIHAARRPVPLDPAIEAAFRASDGLALEVDPRDLLDPAGTAARVEARGSLAPGEDLLEQLPPPTASLLRAALARHALPTRPIRGYEPWRAMLTVLMLDLAAAGFSPTYGVDRAIAVRAGEAERLAGLESVDAQLALFDELPVELQVRMLHETLADGPEEAIRTARGLVEAWQAGDLARFQALTERQLGEDAELHRFRERLYDERNLRMADRIEELLATGGTWFVVVGAAHTVGPQGIPALLEARGRTVRRLHAGETASSAR